MNPHLIYILSDNPLANPNILRLQHRYQSEGDSCNVLSLYELMDKTTEIANLLVVDLDSILVNDGEDFTDMLNNKATRVILLSEDSRRMQKYSSFEHFPTVDELLSYQFQGK